MCHLKEINHPTNRLLEIVCVLFGHDWTSYSVESEEGTTISESNQCARCKLAKRIFWMKTSDTQRKAVAY